LLSKKVINKTDLIERMKVKTGYKKVDIERVINALFETVVEDVLKGGKEIRILNFGTFKPKVNNARTGRNPKTGDALSIPKRTSIAFHTSSNLIIKEAIEPSE
jgi:DNA-binding protein HU-beta